MRKLSLILLTSVFFFVFSCKEDSETPPAVKASALKYAPNSIEVGLGQKISSATPTLEGTSPFTFALTTKPDAGTKITIGDNGVISTSADLGVGAYKVTVSVANQAGAVVFDDVYTVTVKEQQSVTFTTDIEPLITQKCATCHTTGGQTTYTDFTNASTKISAILDRVQRSEGTAGFMPKNNTALTAAEIQLLKDWQAQGLKN